MRLEPVCCVLEQAVHLAGIAGRDANQCDPETLTNAISAAAQASWPPTSATARLNSFGKRARMGLIKLRFSLSERHPSSDSSTTHKPMTMQAL